MVLPQGLHTAIQEKKRAALLSIGSAALLLCLKTFLVIRTDSLGILSEALHSGLDLVAAVITFLSVRVSDQPADERHPYGHGKFEISLRSSKPDSSSSPLSTSSTKPSTGSFSTRSISSGHYRDPDSSGRALD